EVTEEFHLVTTPTSVCDAIIVFRDDAFLDAARLARRLRLEGMNIDLSLLSKKSLGDQLKYADRRGIPWAIVLGQDEISAGQATLKNIGTGEQRTVAQDAITAAIGNGAA
ncbi:MAG TPA: His/Gly/Thr/Pro-type tRNA ligase C-terminal domain-containing protein, partial [Thermomicrobiales bacterium]|nr:His/Gly/Thr/Pro-type tRNA ligase C-terminal domain-containing protein [Thermomicrobiales bacterium]